MEVNDLSSINPNIDYTQILPIQQKRTVAFINHFVMNTVSFLNNFAQSCESRLMEFEYKIQKVEAALLIIESQLSSISGLDIVAPSPTEGTDNSNLVVESHPANLPEIPPSDESVTTNKSIVVDQTVIKTCDDPRYKRFFKMVQVGVPVPAVKLKMQNEGIDPNILDTP